MSVMKTPIHVVLTQLVTTLMEATIVYVTKVTVAMERTVLILMNAVSKNLILATRMHNVLTQLVDTLVSALTDMLEMECYAQVII